VIIEAGEGWHEDDPNAPAAGRQASGGESGQKRQLEI